MTDRELLEMAAKAAGIDYRHVHDNQHGQCLWDGNKLIDWNPLTDDGDAMRLAVTLGLSVMFDRNSVKVSANDEGKCCSAFAMEPIDSSEGATRRAITRAAAFIGENRMSNEINPSNYYISAGDCTGIISYTQETTPLAFEFTNLNNTVGKLWFVDGVLHFDGDADESAKQFYDTFQRLIDSRYAEVCKELEALTQQEPVAYRAWFDKDNGARWLFTLWPEEERLDVDWEPLFTAPKATIPG